MEKIQEYLLSTEFWVSVCVLAGALLLWRFLRFLVQKYLKHNSEKGEKTAHIRFLGATVKTVFAVIVVVSILQINGINVGSLVTGLGVAGVIVGFALQDLLKDLLMGVNIVWDRFFSVGDVVRCGEYVGEVVDFNAKVTKLRDMATDNLVTVCNRNITEVSRVSDWQDVQVPTPYELAPQLAREACSEIARRAAQLPGVTACEFLGTDELADSAIYYRLRLHCPPGEKGIARRATLGILQDVFAERNISIPYPQMDVHLDRSCQDCAADK